MKTTILLLSIGILSIGMTACSQDQDSAKDTTTMQGENMNHEHMEGENKNQEHMNGNQMKSSEKSNDEWIRSEPVDVDAIDENGDGYVYQDMMDWNVIADSEGRCPKCNMVLQKVSIEKANENLKKHGHKVK